MTNCIWTMLLLDLYMHFLDNWSRENLFEVRHISMIEDKYTINIDNRDYNYRE